MHNFKKKTQSFIFIYFKASSMKNERQIDLLKRKIQELTTENQVLREINVKLQIENYNLQKKLESKEEEIDDSIDTALETGTEDPTQKDNFFEFVYSNIDTTNADQDEEYLESDDIVFEETGDTKAVKDTLQEESIAIKRSYSKAFLDGMSESQEKRTLNVPKEEATYQVVFADTGCEEDLFENIEMLEEEYSQLSPKDAMIHVLKLASKTANLSKLQLIEKGKSKDSMFVSKVLELLFDRVTLANSTAHGQKCQSKLHLPARPPLDPMKLEISLKAFIFRLREENINDGELQSRIKSFNKLVNDKIQNCRKCLSRTDSTKTLET